MVIVERSGANPNDRRPIVPYSPEEATALGEYYGNMFNSPVLSEQLASFIDESMAANSISGIIVSIIPDQRHLSITAMTDITDWGKSRETRDVTSLNERRSIRAAFSRLHNLVISTHQKIGLSLFWTNAKDVNLKSLEKIRRQREEGLTRDVLDYSGPEAESYITIIHKLSTN